MEAARGGGGIIAGGGVAGQGEGEADAEVEVARSGMVIDAGAHGAEVVGQDDAASSAGKGASSGARRASGGRELMTRETRRAVLDEQLAGEMVTLYGGMSVQHLGGTPAASHALHLLQGYVWASQTKKSRSSQVKKYQEFAETERRGMPPDEVDLVCFVGYLMYEGSVNASSFTQYLSGVRRYCHNVGLRPLPPTPGESDLLKDALNAAKRVESVMPVKELWQRAGISASQSMAVLLTLPQSADMDVRRRKATWLVLFCFTFRGGTGGALWPKDFSFESDYVMSIKPDVLKRTSSDCTRNPELRPYAVPLATPPEMNPIVFLRSYVEQCRRTIGEDAFMFSPDPRAPGSTEFISQDLVAMAATAGIVMAPGLKLTSHSPRRGMLTEFVLQHPRPADVVIARRMDWSPKAGCVLTYFSRDVIKSEASAIFVPGALQVQMGSTD